MKHLSAFGLALLTTGATAQINVTDSLDIASLSQLLEGLNVDISNVQVDCEGAAMGHFTGSSELAISEGLVLTTGQASLVAAPASTFASSHLETPGDIDLEESLGMGGGITFDACVLEFDCIPLGDTLRFNFSFGSEEYPEFVNVAFNDVFAIYLTGPGYPTPTNVAALPDGTPVAINNVNSGLNAAYFHDNLVPPGQFVSYDGFTTNLTAFAVVSPDDTYRFKVAIADVADGIFDSGVFLEAFSFRSNGLTTGISEARPAMHLLRQGDQVIVHLPVANAEVVLINAAGGIVQRTRASGDSTVLDLAGLAAGLYTVQVLGVRGIAPLRLVKGY